MDTPKENSNYDINTIGVSYELYLDALVLALEMEEISSPMIQREFKVPYHISSKIMDLLQLNGLIDTKRSENGRYKLI